MKESGSVGSFGSEGVPQEGLASPRRRPRSGRRPEPRAVQDGGGPVSGRASLVLRRPHAAWGEGSGAGWGGPRAPAAREWSLVRAAEAAGVGRASRICAGRGRAPAWGRQEVAKQ